MTAFENTTVNTTVEEQQSLSGELQLKLAEVTQSGANRFDPVRFCYIESMAHRARQQRPPVANLVAQKALKALDAYLADLATAEKPPPQSTSTTVTKPKLQYQGALAALTQQLLQGETDNKSQTASFNAQLQQQEQELLQPLGEDEPAAHVTQSETHGELKSIQLFRESWAKISSDKLVSDSIKEGPENPGPLNQHALAIRSLKTMRDLSPQYLNRFVSYIETVLWLEQAGDGIEAEKKKKGKGKAKTSTRRKS